ncbi:hypothetical protein [Aurantiacibacter poecillastricola]|uniref:hypothetical protein n=1 Tax=Aurantiacibacter poecillastricola TaxID=3064385 RepID=UPI00273D1F50|nr:hypothetical protein [Aurantiacibacter sp. 219JJ12-13]MDP5263474.1 hypothetical protein [Aurantiacibacter sp. 219JJ12-13]
MTIADIALAASIIMLAVAVFDWRRGVTGLGKLRLTKEEDPQRYWMALALYFNMAFVMFWLAGNAIDSEIEDSTDINDGNVALIVEGKAP